VVDVRDASEVAKQAARLPARRACPRAGMLEFRADPEVAQPRQEFSIGTRRSSSIADPAAARRSRGKLLKDMGYGQGLQQRKASRTGPKSGAAIEKAGLSFTSGERRSANGFTAAGSDASCSTSSRIEAA